MDILVDMALGLHNLHRPEVAAHPYPFYDRVRALGPVRWDQSGKWVVARYDDIWHALRNSGLTTARLDPTRKTLQADQVTAQQPLYEMAARVYWFQDGSAHARMRSVLNKLCSPAALAARVTGIRGRTSDLMSQAERTGRFDVIEDFSWPLAHGVLFDLIGVPPADRTLVWSWSTALTVLASPKPYLTEDTAQQLKQVIAECQRYFRDLVARYRRTPGDDLLSALLASEQEHGLSEEELWFAWLSFILPGIDPLAAQVGNMILALLRWPDQTCLLRDNPSLLAAAVEEILRYDTAIHFDQRWATEDLEIAGRSVRFGQPVLLLFAAGNRDPYRFSQPDRLEFTRQPLPHLGFGLGSHYCLGAPLMRLVLAEVLAAVLVRWSHLRLTRDAEDTARVWHGNTLHLHSLPVAL